MRIMVTILTAQQLRQLLAPRATTRTTKAPRQPATTTMTIHNRNHHRQENIAMCLQNNFCIFLSDSPSWECSWGWDPPWRCWPFTRDSSKNWWRPKHDKLNHWARCFVKFTWRVWKSHTATLFWTPVTWWGIQSELKGCASLLGVPYKYRYIQYI